MAYTNTTLLGLNLPTTGSESGVWGDDVNNGLTILIDISVAGTNNITQDSDITLAVTNGSNSSSFTSTATNSTVAQYAVLNCTGARTAGRSIIVPAFSKLFVVYNNTSGGFSITVKKTAGTGVVIAPGEKALVYYDNVTAADVIKVLSTTVLGTVTTGTWNGSVIGAAYGGTGIANNAASTITITGNFATTITISGPTTVALPTSGTLLTTAGSGSSLTFGTGSLSLAGNLTTSGAFATTITTTATTNSTLPAGTFSLGYINIPQNSQSAAYTTVLADAGKTIFHPASDANARTFTIDSNANVAYALGTVIQFINMSASNVTIAITSDTLTWAQGGGTGSRTLAQYGVANCIKIATTQWLLTGTNVT